MKNIFKSIAIAAVTITAVSCDDSLDRIPVDELTPATAFISLNDVQQSLNGMYDSYPTYYDLAVNSLATDNIVIGPDNGGQDINLYNLQIFAAGGDQGLYLSYSRLANRASRALDAAEIVPFDENDPAEVARRNDMMGQAYGMRAFAYYKMFEYFTPNYTDPNGLSVPYLQFTAGSSDFPPRETVSDFGVKFEDDLAQAESLLSSSAGIDVVNGNFINMLRAKFALLTGDNTTAINLSNSLINNSGTTLANQTQYVNMFDDTDNTEVLFKRVFTLADGGRIAGPWFFTAGGGEKYSVSQDLVAELDQTNDPARYDAIILDATESPAANATGFGVGKYPGSGGVIFLNDYKDMRLSEVYLILAEAHARENQLTDAADAMQDLRDIRLNVSPTITYSSQDEALTDILEERRIELAFEGHRYLDLKRFGEGYERDPSECGGVTPCELTANDHRFTLPIPLTEVQNNPNITENNPGY